MLSAVGYATVVKGLAGRSGTGGEVTGLDVWL